MSLNSLNAFEALAEQQIANPVKAKARAQEKRAVAQPPQTAAEKKLREQQRLLANYRRAHREIWRKALEGEHGPKLAALKRDLRRFGPEQANEFVAHVEALDWPATVDDDTRAIVLSLIGSRVVRIRTSAGFHPFDDALPGEPDCAWVRCRKAILGR